MSLAASSKNVFEDESQRRDKAFLCCILMGLGNCLSDPEEAVIKQDDKMDKLGDEEHDPAIYFLKGGGRCKVKVRDHMARERV